MLHLTSYCKEEPVILVDANGVERKCKLRELTGTERNKYLNKMTSRVKLGKDGKAVGITSFDGFQSDLLCKSLVDENDELFTTEDIEELPSSTQQKLFEASQELSGLNGVEAKEKND